MVEEIELFHYLCAVIEFSVGFPLNFHDFLGFICRGANSLILRPVVRAAVPQLTALLTESRTNEDIWPLCLTFLIGDAVGRIRHTLAVCLRAVSVVSTVSFFTELHYCLQGLTTALMNSHTHTHTVRLGLCVYVIAPQTFGLQDCGLKNKICERRGSAQEKNGVHCVRVLCALVHAGGSVKWALPV